MFKSSTNIDRALEVLSQSRRLKNKPASIEKTPMGRIDLYILKQIFSVMLVTLFISAAVLLLEKMLQLLELTAGSGVSSVVVFQMILSLFPNYIRLVLPLGLFLGVLITFRRLVMQQELQVLFAGGFSLSRVSRPAKVLACIVTFFGLALTGYVEPLGRFVFHSLQYQVTNGIVDAGIGEGIFFDMSNGYTVRVNQSTDAGMEFYGFFGYREQESGTFDTVTAARGQIIVEEKTGHRKLVLLNGERQVWAPGGRRTAELKFSVLEIPMTRAGGDLYPTRGSDPLELTLHELAGAYAYAIGRVLGVKVWSPSTVVEDLAVEIPLDRLAAEFHGRLIYALSILVMPFLAIPLAIGSPRSNRNVGLVVGLVSLLAYQKTIEFGQKVSAVSQLPAGPFLWGSFAIFFGLSVYLFKATAQATGQTPFQMLESQIRHRFKLRGTHKNLSMA